MYPLALLQDKTLEQLYYHAKYWYDLEEKECKTILKDAGYTTFKKVNYFIYLNELRKHWNHIQEETITMPPTKEERIGELKKLAANVHLIETPKGWDYTGTEEEKTAYFKLQDIARKKNVRTCPMFRGRVDS